MADGGSDIGDRVHQEDAWLVCRRPGAVLCAVCDGMGGNCSGHPAAALALSTLRAPFERGAPPEEVLDGVAEANRAIFARSEAARRRMPGSDISWHGMGTTAVAAVFVPGRAYLAHVGDSRIYRMGRTLEQLTTDHTLVNEYRRQRPELSEAGLRALPPNVIVRALGMREEVEVDRSEVATVEGDVFLLCSDGLTHVVDDDTIASVLSSRERCAVMVEALLQAAKDSCDPQKDNATAVVCSGGEDHADERARRIRAVARVAARHAKVDEGRERR